MDAAEFMTMYMAEEHEKQKSSRQVTEYLLKLQKKEGGFCSCISRLIKPNHQKVLKVNKMNNFNSSKVIDDIETIVKARNVNVTNAQNSMFNLEASSEAVKIQQVNTDAIKMFFNNVDVELQQITKKIEEQDSNQSIDYDKIWGDELSPQADSKVKVVEMQILGTN